MSWFFQPLPAAGQSGINIIAVTKTLSYAVVASPAAITKSLTYVIDDGLDYSREGMNSLGTDESDLAILYSDVETDNVATDDGTRVALVVLDKTYAVHHFRVYNANNNDTDAFTITVNVQTLVAPSSRSVVLQVYNFTDTAWETLDTESAASAATDFDLTGTVDTDVSDYYNADNEVVFRVYQ